MDHSLRLFIDKRTDFLGFLKTRYSLFHLSNLFFRDLHYGVMAFLEMNGLQHAYTPSEELTRKVIGVYEKDGLLLPVDGRTWMLNYLPFRKAPAKPAPPAKPTPPAPVSKPATDLKPSASKPVAASPAASTAASQSIPAVAAPSAGSQTGPA
ncbi:MAG TPA: hypothetical protein VMM37_04370 [Bacteroidota bacterium]|nr:hypothetical protein [Bacteroidota bacterium]